jgi:hypothetical protein
MMELCRFFLPESGDTVPLLAKNQQTPKAFSKLHLGAFFCGKPQKNRALRGSALTRSGPGYAVAAPHPSNPLRASTHPYGVSVFSCKSGF